MYKIPDTPCRKCGGNTHLTFVPSTGMDIEPTGMKRSCGRCGYSEFIDDLDSENDKVPANE
jgi:predicted nucleic-acid-binding Zn-ribbon protein